jgi:hypothetical protein
MFPMLIGSGKRLFAEGSVPAWLKLVDHQASVTGVVLGADEPAGNASLDRLASDLGAAPPEAAQLGER